MRDEIAIGAISLNGKRGGFSQSQIDLLKTFAEQAVIAITSAETYRVLQQRTLALTERNTEYSERLAYQEAMTAVLEAMSASPGDPMPAFEMMTRRAHELLGCASVAVFEYDGRLVHMRTYEGSLPQDKLAAYQALFPMVPNRTSLACRTIIEKRTIHIRNLEAEPDLLAIVRDIGIRTVLSIPLMREGRVVGAFNMNSFEKDAFNAQQESLLQTFAEQAVIAITSAETYRALQTRTADLQESLEQQIATSEVLQVINANPGNLTPVFDALLDKALRLCNAPFGGLYVRDGMQARGVAVRGMPPAYAAYRRENSISLERKEHPLARCMDTARPVEITDVATDDSIYAEDRPVLIELAGVRSILDVPLLKDGRGIGAIAIYQRRPGRFARAQVALLENFAAQAVIAMENARLITETREALEQQTATSEVLQTINLSRGDLAPVFEAILEKAMRLCDASFGILRINQSGRFHGAASLGVPAAYADFLAQNLQKPQSGSIGARILEGEPLVHIVDVADDATYHLGDPHRRALVELGGARTSLVVAMKKDSAVLGAIQLYRKHVQAFTDKQIAVLRNFAAQAVIAMENARLLNEFASAPTNFRSARRNYASRSRTWATASPCSTKSQHLVAGTASFRRSSTCPTCFSNSIAPMRNTFASLQPAATSARVPIRRSRFMNWSPLPANPTATSERGRTAG